MDVPWDGSTPSRTGLWSRITGALGRALGRKSAGLAIVDPSAPPRPSGKARRRETGDRTRPIDTNDLEPAEAPTRTAQRAAVKPPPPVPRAATSPVVRAPTAPSMRALTSPGRAITEAEQPHEFDPLDGLITLLLREDGEAAPPIPTDNQLAWLERLDALIEYELMARGGTALTFQTTAAQLGELIALGDTDFNAAVRLVSREPAVAAAVLSAANSAEFQRGGAVTEIRAAVSRLGVPETRRIGVAIATRALHDVDARGLSAAQRARGERDLHRSLTCALANAALAARMGSVPGEDAFVAGMFFDLGRPLVHRAVQALERRGRVEAVPEDALALVVDRTHAAVGADSLIAWGLPQRLGDFARYHLDGAPPSSADGKDLQRLTLVSSLVLLRAGERIPLAAARRVIVALGLDRAAVRGLALEVAELADRVTEAFGVRDAATSWAAAF